MPDVEIETRCGRPAGTIRRDATMKAVNRIAAALAAFCMLAAGAGEAMAQSAGEQRLYEAAKKERSLTWYAGAMDQAINEKVGQAFTAKFPGIEVEVTKTTAQVAFQRVLQDIKAGQAQADIFTSTDASHFVYLKDKGALVKYVPENADKVLPAFQNIDPDGFFHVTKVTVASIIYNTNKVKAADAPKSWRDLLDPKWANQVAVASPSFSGAVGVWTIALDKLYGWDFFTKLNAQKPQIGRSIDDGVTLLNSGERVVALGQASTAFRSAAKGNPIGVVYPTDGVVVTAAPSGIIKGSKSPNAAKLFMEFLLSAEYSQLIATYYEQPIRADVPPAPGALPLSGATVITPSVADITKEMPAIVEKWKETFGM
jgi:iron(III) transport system substrate-binding protein